MLPFLVCYTIMAVYAERKLSAFMQDRLGPMEVGPYGLLQTIADLLKLLQKEQIENEGVLKWMFRLAPILIFVAVFTGFAAIPLSPEWPGAGFSSALLFVIAIVSLDVIGILVAGWASGNKYASLGSLRAAVQLISYEIPVGLCLGTVVLYTGTLDLQQISWLQSAGNEHMVPLAGVRAWDVGAIGGFLTWNIFQMPILLPVWGVFFIATLAESNRAPFDLPEGESELVAGFQTEYSGFRWAIIMLAEYAMMLLAAFLSAVLFFGSWNSPIPNIGSWTFADWTTGPIWGIFWLTGKALLLVGVQIWIRWTFPRVRIDQLINLNWKYLIPASMILFLLAGFWKMLLILP